MLKKPITYTDYNGQVRTENFYFNLTRSELVEMELTTVGGFVDWIDKIVETEDRPTLYRLFKEIILKSYGEKSADGKRFEKSEEISIAFSQTPAFDELIMEFFTDKDAASKFMNAVIPKVDEPAVAPAAN